MAQTTSTETRQLRHAAATGEVQTFYLTDGQRLVGTPVEFDRYTITIQIAYAEYAEREQPASESGYARIYKHAITFVSGVTPWALQPKPEPKPRKEPQAEQKEAE